MLCCHIMCFFLGYDLCGVAFRCHCWVITLCCHIRCFFWVITCRMWPSDTIAGLQRCVAISDSFSGLWPLWCGFQMPLLGYNIMLPYQVLFLGYDMYDVAFRCLCWVTAWVVWANCVAQWPLKPLLLPSSHTSTCSTSGLLRLQVCAVQSFPPPRSYAGELGQQITKCFYRDLN